MKKIAFTLAEIMIALTVIGIITAILLPVAFQTVPDDNVMKFKKANSTLYKVISELVTSGEYFTAGNLSKKADGTDILGGFALGSGATTSDTALIKHFCTSFSDVVSAKSVACSTANTNNTGVTLTSVEVPTIYGETLPTGQYTLDTVKAVLDTACASAASTVGAEIKLIDDVVYYQANPSATFGTMNNTSKLFETKDSGGLLDTYKPICIDVDGIGVDEAPFGYGVRIDGKIILGARAQEWLKKDIQNND